MPRDERAYALLFRLLVMLASVGASGALGCRSTAAPGPDGVRAKGAPEASAEAIAAERVVKTDREWRRKLSSKAYRVTRRRRTERAWSGDYVHETREGTYRCVGCGLALFPSATKFDAGTGWPSFSAPVDDAHVLRREDRRGGFRRTEVRCARCNAHLGHVFDGGPEPSGLRYCINSVAMALDAAEANVPPLDAAPHGRLQTATFALG